MAQSTPASEATTPSSLPEAVQPSSQSGAATPSSKSETAQPLSKSELEVSAAVESFRKALIDPDKATLDKLVVDQLTYGHSSGVIQDKGQFEAALLSKSSDFVTIDLTNQTIQVVGNTAWVRHILSATTNDGGKPGSTKLSVLLIWVKQKGDWRLLARQAVKVTT